MTLRIELDLGPEREAAVQARAGRRGVSLAELIDRALAQEAGYPDPRRVEARLQEVNARLVLHDGRFAAAGDRVNQADRRLETLSSRLNERLATVTRRADALDDHSERVEHQLGTWSGQAHTIEQRLGLQNRILATVAGPLGGVVGSVVAAAIYLLVVRA